LQPRHFPPLLIRQPEHIADLATGWAEDLAIGPAHRRDFINANLLITKVLNRVYESGWYAMNEAYPTGVSYQVYIPIKFPPKMADEFRSIRYN